MVCDDNEQGQDDWLEAGQRAVMLMTSSMHHLDASGEWVDETKRLLTGLTPCEMALTLVWVTRIGSDALLETANDKRDEALAKLRELGLTLEEALSGMDLAPDVRD